MTKQQFETCFNKYYKPLVLSAVKLVKRQDTAEDIVQQVFINVWKKIDEMDIKKGIRSYLFQSTRNHCLNYLTTVYHRGTLHWEVLESNNLTASKREDIETKELSLLISTVIKELPQKCREIFLLSRERFLTYREIAAVLDISVKTVENQVGKALRILYKRLNDHLEVVLVIFFVILWKSNIE